MKFRPTCLALLTFVFASITHTQAAPTAAADGLRTVTGEILPGRIVGVHGSAVVVATKKAHLVARLGKLDDESLNKVADFISGQPGSPPRWAGSTSSVARSLDKKLLILQESKLVPLVLGDRPEPEFYLAYFSAHWCPPCRRFTPILVEAYAKLQAKYPGSFELVFLSGDESSADQTKYVRESKMPWPVVKFSEAGSIRPFAQWHGRGIPDLLVTDREGYVIFKSYVGEEYIGPDAVLEQFTQLLATSNPTDPATRQSRHRLETLLYLRASAHTTLPAKPYLIRLDPRRYQTLPTSEFTATLKLDAAGKVTAVVSTTPELSYILLANFQADAADWLFLPSANHGLGQVCTVEVPVKILR